MNERPYQKLIVWKEAHSLCLQVYAITKSFPSDEKFALTKQMQRASYSVPMNIAEGNAKHSKKDHAHFLEIANGSLDELHYQCILAHDLGYLATDSLEKINDSIQRVGFLLHKLRSSLL